MSFLPNPPLGQDTMSDSLPVAIASDQSGLPVTGTFWQATQPVSGTVTANAGTGTFAISASSLPLPTGAATESTLSTLNGKVTTCNTGAVTISAALPAGSNNIGDIDVLTLPALASGTNTIGNAGAVSVATGGYTPGKLISAASTNATSVKASAGKLGWLSLGNINAAARYFKLYNKASSPTVGTDTPILTLLIPGNTAGAGNNPSYPSEGIDFSTGIAFAITTGVADSDTGAVAANEITVNYGFK